MRILIVEDDRRMADLLKRGLEEECHSVTLAHSGPDGLAAAQSAGFDAIVLDVMLPGLDGFRIVQRLRALARRGAPPKPGPIRYADLTLDPATHEVRRGSIPAALTRTEYNILELLMRNAGRVITRDRLIEAVWGVDREIESNTLDAFMSLLRSKIDTGSSRKLIHTVRGVGYSLRDGDAR